MLIRNATFNDQSSNTACESCLKPHQTSLLQNVSQLLAKLPKNERGCDQKIILTEHQVTIIPDSEKGNNCTITSQGKDKWQISAGSDTPVTLSEQKGREITRIVEAISDSVKIAAKSCSHNIIPSINPSSKKRLGCNCGKSGHHHHDKKIDLEVRSSIIQKENRLENLPPQEEKILPKPSSISCPPPKESVCGEMTYQPTISLMSLATLRGPILLGARHRLLPKNAPSIENIDMEIDEFPRVVKSLSAETIASQDEEIGSGCHKLNVRDLASVASKPPKKPASSYLLWPKVLTVASFAAPFVINAIDKQFKFIE